MIKTGEAMKLSLIGHEFRFFGHRFHTLESSRDTDDASLRLEYVAPPGANISEHIHHVQEEQFAVISGRLGVRVGGQELILGPGESAIGPQGVPHAWWNPSDEEEVCFVAGVRPGLDVETMFETMLGLAREGKTIGSLPRNPLQLAVLVRHVGGMAYPTGLPKPVRKVLFAPVAVLAFVGGLLGYRARYPEYSGRPSDG
jgi:quercetin dioxygenase-like cupin family protein